MELLQALQLLSAETQQLLEQITLVITIALALATCFLGFRLRKAWCTLLVFGAGFLLTYAIASRVMPDGGAWPMLIALAGGILASALTYRLYQVLGFVLGFCCAWSLLCRMLLGQNEILVAVLSIAGGIAAGVLVAKHQYKAIILATAVSGGWRAAADLAIFLALPTNTMYILALALMAGGAIVQLITCRKLAK